MKFTITWTELHRGEIEAEDREEAENYLDDYSFHERLLNPDSFVLSENQIIESEEGDIS